MTEEAAIDLATHSGIHLTEEEKAVAPCFEQRQAMG